MNAKRVTQLFNVMGVPPNYKGYPYLVYVICLAISSGYPFPTLKTLYAQTAEHFGVSSQMVTEDIRFLVNRYWDEEEHVKRFNKIIHYPVKDKLTVKEFVSVVSEFLINHPRKD